MVDKVFKVSKSTTSWTGWELIDTDEDVIIEFPECCFNELQGRYLSPNGMLERLDTIRIALAGVSNSMNIVDPVYLHKNSVIKYLGIKKGLSDVDDSFEQMPESVSEYEKYHTIKMGRDTQGDDSTIHAYIVTPNDGKLRCIFDKSVRQFAKRNNIPYWVEDYKIEEGTNGGKFVRPLDDPEEY